MLSLSPVGEITGGEALSWPWVVLPWRRGVLWVKSNCFSCPLQCILVISPCPRQCVESFPPETWISARALLSLGDYLRQSSPGTPRLWLRWAGAGPQTTSGSTARTEVYVPITQSIGGWHTFWVPQHRVLDPRAPPVTFVHSWMWNCCRWGREVRNILFSHLANFTLLVTKY